MTALIQTVSTWSGMTGVALALAFCSGMAAGILLMAAGQHCRNAAGGGQ